jgi:hypothetical protein
MSNLKISQLNTYTGSTPDLRWFVMNNSGETATFKYSGYTSPLRNYGFTTSFTNAYDTQAVSSTYQMIVGGELNSIAATNAPYCSIVGARNCTITTRHNGKGYGSGIYASTNSTIGSSEDSTANFGANIFGSTGC